MDFLRASRHFNVQSAASANPFWTFSRLPAASANPFWTFSRLPAASANPFWTSSVLPAASTSNLPLLQIPFGLSPAFLPLQRPIRRSCKSLLDFLPPSCRFNVQSAASTHVFVVYEYFINYYLTLMSEYFIFLL